MLTWFEVPRHQLCQITNKNQTVAFRTKELLLYHSTYMVYSKRFKLSMHHTLLDNVKLSCYWRCVCHFILLLINQSPDLFYCHTFYIAVGCDV